MRLITFLLSLLVALPALAQPLSYYFSDDIKFDPAIATPESVLGYEVGEWHVRHDQLVRYMQVLAEQSDRINIETIGYTHEQRPLLMLTISTPDKLANIENIRQAHLARLKAGSKTNQDAPAVLWMGYSVHGNEPSGSNAALLVAYYLAAAQGKEIDELLSNTVILLDPSINPDGLARFANWANSNRGINLSADPMHREHDENWPNGRSNHYWFDLNRDWLLLQHPESRARIAKFHQWKPNVLTDFHEMGSNSTFFFQPGIPTRKHPLTPEFNVTLTKAIAEYHAKTLDSEKALYFTEESYDDFYYGKGSTYPDINGGVGILFEQASSRGHVQDTIHGPLRFPFTIKNQLLTSLSTFKASLAERKNLLDYQRKFYLEASDLADKDDIKGYVVGASEDTKRMADFLSILQQHRIQAYPLSKDLKSRNGVYDANSSYFIPLAQPQYRLIKAVFSEQKDFPDNTFYDISGWTLAHAFNLKFTELNSLRGLDYGRVAWQPGTTDKFGKLQDGYAYAFSWTDYQAPKLLNRLLQNGVNTKVAHTGFTVETNRGLREFGPGSIVIPAGVPQPSGWLELMQSASDETGIEISTIKSGLTQKGIDIGSRSMTVLKAPKVLIVGGRGVSPYEAGEAWYYLDRFVGLAPSIVEKDRLATLDLARYTHIMLVDGNYRDLSEGVVTKLKRWIDGGGVIWGQKRGARFLADQQILKAEYVSEKDVTKALVTDGLSYGDQDMLAGKQRIAGAIFASQIDLTHPLSYSLERDMLPLFKNSPRVFKPLKAPFVTVASYTANPLLAGYTDPGNVAQIAQTPAIMAHNFGNGRVVAMADDPVFRGFWYGSSRILSNALFFGHSISAAAN